MVVEAVGGWISGSLALLADAGHMLTDVGALALSLLTAWIAQRPAGRQQDLRLPPVGDPGGPGERRGAVRHRRLGGGRGGAADPGPPAGPDRPVPGHRLRRAAGQPGEPRGPPRLPGRAASTCGAPTSTCWATRWARSARSSPPAIIALTGWTPGRPDRLHPPVRPHPGRGRAAPPGKHRHPAGVGAPARLHGGSAAPHARRARGRGGPRPPRLDGHQRHGRDERARRGARSGGPPRGAGRNPRRDVTDGDRARHHPARGRARVRGVRRCPGSRHRSPLGPPGVTTGISDTATKGAGAHFRTLLRHPTALSIYAPRRPGVRASPVLNPGGVQDSLVDP